MRVMRAVGALTVAALYLSGMTDASADPTASETVTGPGSGSAPPQLRREGRWLVDQYGRVVLLHGVNLVWKRAPYAPPATPAGFTEADATRLKSA